MACFVAADLEGTCTTGEGWRGISSYLRAHGRARDQRRFFISHFLPALASRLGMSDKQAFRNRWLADQAALLHGYSTAELQAIAEWVVENEMWVKRRVNVIEELQRHHADGCTIILATGAYEPIANAFARHFPFDKVLVVATPLEMVNDRATGKLAAEIGVDTVKAQRVRALVGSGTLAAAYGDTAADVPLLEASAAPVAVSPDTALAKIANERGWRVL